MDRFVDQAGRCSEIPSRTFCAVSCRVSEPRREPKQSATDRSDSPDYFSNFVLPLISLHRPTSQLQHNISTAPCLRIKSAHRLPLTASTLSEDGLMLFSSSKDGSIIKWDMLTGRRLATFPKLRAPATSKGKGRADKVEGHTDEVLGIAVSSDGRWLASGGKDRRVVVWDAREMKWVKSFTGHKDGVTVSSLLHSSKLLGKLKKGTPLRATSRLCSARTRTSSSPPP